MPDIPPLQITPFYDILIFIANFLKLLYHLKCNFDRLRSDQEGTESPKP